MPVMSHLPSRRKAGRGFPFHPLLVFQMPLLAIFSEISQKYFFRGSCCAPFVLFGWMFLPERRAAGSGSPRRKSAGNDKKRPHRHKSLHGRFGAVQYGNCRRLSEGIGILRCPGIVRLCSRRGCGEGSGDCPGRPYHTAGRDFAVAAGQCRLQPWLHREGYHDRFVGSHLQERGARQSAQRGTAGRAEHRDAESV